MSPSPEPLRGPDDIWEYYLRMKEALREMSKSPTVATTVAPSLTATWASLPNAEEMREQLRSELDLEVALALIASYEGRVRQDYRSRIKAKGADPVSRQLRRQRFGRRKWVRIDELLDVWKASIPQRTISDAVGTFRQVLNTRDWLAHGRVDQPLGGPPCTPEQARVAGNTLLANFGI